jgi:membrane-bound serine protease (ClpP class)
VASSVDDLLKRIDGEEVVVAGVSRLLETKDLTVYNHTVDWRSEFLAVLTNPNVAYVLMLIGIYGLIIEFYSPGFGLPGVLGAVCLLLALYAFHALPISYAGLGLLLLGVGLMAAEAFMPSFGVLGVGGIAAFIFGSIMLMDTELPGYQIAMPMIAGFAAFSFGLLVFALGMLLRARHQAVVTGVEHMLGAKVAVESVEDGGQVAWVRLDGELWQVACDHTLAPNDKVIVRAIDGLTLQVSREPGGIE